MERVGANNRRMFFVGKKEGGMLGVGGIFPNFAAVKDVRNGKLF